MRDVKQTTSLLAVVFDFLNSAHRCELDQLINGKARLQIVPIDEAQSQPEVEVEKPLRKPNGAHHLPLRADARGPIGEDRAYTEVDEVARKLNEAASREVAEDLIASINVPKGKGRRDFLIRLAKACSVQVESKDTIAKIERKLVEYTVGAKLRTKAFREVAF